MLARPKLAPSYNHYCILILSATYIPHVSSFVAMDMIYVMGDGRGWKEDSKSTFGGRGNKASLLLNTD